jgi:Glyoxalase/Bleomycin resistance protein/Dioxygenase superfamily
MSTPFADPPGQLGCVVSDLGAAIEQWAERGVGPFLMMRGVTLGGYVYRGRPSKPKIHVGFSQQGETQIELIQPVNDEPSAYRDFLAEGRSGDHHHGWFCDDYPAEVLAAAAAGRSELQHGNWGAVRFTYYEPAREGEMVGELIEMGPLSQRIFALIRERAERWDGTHPARSLLGAADWGLRLTAAKVQIATLLGRS